MSRRVWEFRWAWERAVARAERRDALLTASSWDHLRDRYARLASEAWCLVSELALRWQEARKRNKAEVVA